MKNVVYVIMLIWSVSFLAGFASAEPGDVRPGPVEPEGQPMPRVFEAQKPVTCTTDTYDVVKQNFFKSHGEEGLMRWVGDQQTGVEVIGNITTGTITILEYLQSNKSTCFISLGKGLEVNSLILKKAEKGIEASY